MYNDNFYAALRAVSSSTQASLNGDVGNATRLGIANTFVNTMITTLHTQQWEMLLQRSGAIHQMFVAFLLTQSDRIGADAMLHLLTETSIFVSLPNECFCQITGEPIVHITVPQVKGASISTSCKRKSLEPHAEENSAKRLRLQTSMDKPAHVAGSAKNAKWKANLTRCVF